MSIMNWEILLFVIPLCLGVLMTLGAACGLAEQGSGDFDADPSDVGDLGDAEGLGDAEAEDLDGPTAAPDGGATGLEIGKPPLVVRLMAVCLTFGATGLVVSYLFGAEGSSLLRVKLAAAAALVCAWLAGRATERLFRKRVRLLETAALRRRDLVGSLGKVVLPVGALGGLVQLHDRHGDLHQVSCRVSANEPPLPSGAPVLVTDYDDERDVFEVMKRPASLE